MRGTLSEQDSEAHLLQPWTSLMIETVNPTVDKKRNNWESNCFERYQDGPFHFPRTKEEDS